MHDDDIKTKTTPNWFEKLSAALLREPQNREQLINLIRDAEHRNLLDADDIAMIEGVIQVSELQVRDIMIPRTQMVILNESSTLDDLLPQVITSGHSRFPVISANKDEIIGILHAKDLLRYWQDQENKFELSDILRPAVIVPESKRLDILLKEFRVNRNHMAIVVDEYGTLAGCVTIEDILEQIVGDIADEFDIDEEANIRKHSETEFIINAQTPIDDFNDYFNCALNDEAFDTIGGLVIQGFGHVPKRGETVTIDHFQFHVLHADHRRIRLLQATIVQPEDSMAKEAS